MAEFRSMPANDAQIQEGRNFSNPIVRFRKIKGRIVPIWNKSRIGKEVGAGSNKIIAAGSVIGAYGIGKKIYEKKMEQKVNKFASVAKKLPSNFTYGSWGKLSSVKSTKTAKVLSAASKGLKFLGKNPLKIGASLVGIGVLGKFYGTHLQASSELGLDIGAE